MKALAVADGHVGLVERPTPEPVADQVVVDVAGSGVNRADLLQRRGRYPAPPGWPQDVPGLEFAGRVRAVGPATRALAPGERVFGIVGGGAHATHVLTTEPLCARVPESLDLVEAAAVPEAFVTAHDAMLVQARLRPGERVLIHGVGSGVGTAAVQLARALGAWTIGTSRTPEKLDRAKELGLDEGVVADGDLADEVEPVDVVVDLVGGSYVSTDVRVCRPKGRIVVVGLVAGASATVDLGTLMRARLTVTGTVLRSRPEHEKAAAVSAFAAEVVPLLERGVLRPVIDRIMPLSEGDGAYDLVASNATFGKVVLTP